ncbi:LCP family protein required for cell wall assembly [Peribacillus deserti]|uniref:Polyisoprenyl-teichoic acid--peptidoglycan teichoic acid transferase TagU n=1 Tax=Peribacillus deserti TaxID=673318 RepID=A0ABS2QCI8_9BACI|nr:LytR family transcriptional regulator [Peribacillus deserti]MBM7690807.1 LCP family protein required for cell wall assembly [Peribacillus deserti]
MRSRRRKKLRWQKVVSLLLLMFLIGGGTYIFSVYKSLAAAVETMHSPIDNSKSDKRQKAVTLENQQPFSVLLLGVDQRKNDSGRSDTMIVLTVNPTKKSVEMMSIPRDTRTEMIGKGTEDKINHAYAYGGIGMSIKTVENFLDIPIDYYVELNMEGFQSIVDSVGGVTVHNDLEFSDKGYHFNKGPIELDGKKALVYSRMRHQDPRGDFGRQLRQRQVMKAVINEGASLSTVNNYDKILKALGNNLKTNLTFDQMVDIQKNYGDARKNIKQFQINGTNERVNGIFYYIVPEEERKTVTSRLREHLEI